MRHRIGVTPTFLLALFLCVSPGLLAHTSTLPISDTARDYLEAVISLAESNYINRTHIDWSSLRREAFSRASGAKTPSDTYPVVQWVVASLGDHHSAFFDPVALKSLSARSAAASGTPQGRVIADRFGVVTLPTFGSPDQAAIDRFATDVQGVISTVAQSAPCGWVIDLRANGGGNMWAMLAGVDELLGAQRVGAFQRPVCRQSEAWRRAPAPVRGAFHQTVRHRCHRRTPAS